MAQGSTPRTPQEAEHRSFCRFGDRFFPPKMHFPNFVLEGFLILVHEHASDSALTRDPTK